VTPPPSSLGVAGSFSSPPSDPDPAAVSGDGDVTDVSGGLVVVTRLA
jgi:hypothetical protein